MVSVNSSSTISEVSMNSSSVWAVNWDLLVVLSESISVGIWIREKSSLEHLIIGWLNSWNEVRWGESGLLDLGVIVLWVSIQGHLTNFNKWVVTVWPDLGNIEDIKSIVLGILFWHDLYVPCPRWEVLGGNGVVKIRGGEILILEGHLVEFSSSEVLDTLVSFEMVFDKVDISFIVDPLEGVGTISVHESVTIWGSSVREQDCDLVKSLWGVLPEIEDHVWISQVSGWVSLLGVKEVWELNWVIDEEDWSIVSNHIIISLLGVELDGKASWVSDGISGSSLASDGGESEEEWGLLANLVKEGSLGEHGHILSNLEDSVGTRSFGMDNSLWDSLSIEVSELVNKGEVLKQDWASWSSSH